MPVLDQSRALATLAFLKSAMDEGQGDYLSLLEPLAVETLASRTPHFVTPDDLAVSLAQDFGISVHPAICSTVINRLIKNGTLRREDTLILLRDDFAPPSLADELDARRTATFALCEDLSKYAKADFNLEWSGADAMRVFTAFLSKFSISYLSYFLRNTSLPTVATNETEFYVVSAFIKRALDERPAEKLLIEALVRGTMLANVLLCEDISNMKQDLSSLNVYLDTSLLLCALGINSEQQEQAIKELLLILKKLKVRILVFDHTISELRGLILKTENSLGITSVRRGLYRWVIRRKLRKSDLVLIRQNIETKLRELGIGLARPISTDRCFVSRSDIDSKINTFLSYRNIRALDYDIDSVEKIIVLRQGARPIRLEDSDHVFVSHNTKLVDAANAICARQPFVENVGVALSDMTLGNMAWMRVPMSSSLPTLQLAAICNSAIDLSDDQLEHVLEVADGLEECGEISSDEIFLLRNEALSSDLAFIMAGEGVVSAVTIGQALERYKERVNKPLSDEVKRLRSLYVFQNTKTQKQREDSDKVSIVHARVLSWLAFLAVASLVLFFATLTVLKTFDVEVGPWGLAIIVMIALSLTPLVVKVPTLGKARLRLEHRLFQILSTKRRAKLSLD